MKPVRIEIQAFESYAGTEIVDFGKLGERSLFLIHGPTGSGKSSLLDAIAFALYGEGAVGERNVIELRSHRAQPDLATRVVFDFTLGAERYRVERYPTQERKKRRGDGVVTDQTRATLWRRTSLDDETAEGAVIATKPGEVTVAIEKLLGFRAEEFRQVVLLPQGQFQKFLLAKSSERQQILERLFQTSLYRRIELALKENAQDIRNEYEQLCVQRDTILAQTGNETIEALRTRHTDTTVRLEVLQKSILSLNNDLKSTEQESSNAQAINRAFDEHDGAVLSLSTIEAVAALQMERRGRYDRAKAAESLQDIVRQSQDREKARATAKTQLEMAELAYSQALMGQKAAATLLQAEQKKELEREAARKAVDGLEAVKQKLKGYEEAEHTFEVAKKEEQEAANNLGSLKESQKQCRADKARLQKEIEKTKELSANRGGLAALCRELKTAHKQADDLRKKSKDAKESEKTHELAQKAVTGMITRHKAAEKQFNEVQRNWIKGQAARLAKALEEGEPCPVCGSIRHPSPCQSRVELPSDDELESAREALEEIKQELDEAKKNEANAHRHLDVLNASIASIRSTLGDHVERTPADIERQLSQAITRHDAAKEAEETIAKQEEELGRLMKKDERIELQIDSADKKIKKLSDTRSEADGLCRERRREIPKEIKSAADLEAALHKSRAHHQLLETLFKNAQTEDGRMRVVVATSEANRKAAISIEQQSKNESELAGTETARRLQEAGFTGLPEYQAVVMDKKTMEMLLKEINNYDVSLVSAKALASATSEKITGLERKDIASIQTRLEKCRTEHNVALEKAAGFQHEITSITRAIGAIDALESVLREKESTYQVTGRLAEVANGTNSYRMTLQAYVLGAFLDEVLMAATVRLRRMTRGRYGLQRRTGTSDGRAKSGLDLEIYDDYSGTTRSAPSLSGGEQFMASLALALGLADVVRNFAGGIQLDTVFIDEGFGTLDTETLDQAMQTLLELQETGRLVGLISHVSELKERIPTRLEVIPSPAGSTTRFVI